MSGLLNEISSAALDNVVVNETAKETAKETSSAGLDNVAANETASDFAFGHPAVFRMSEL